jgi:hypothetical protein
MFRKEGTTVKETEGPQIVQLEQAIFNETDSDADGVKDWEETIWRTDPNNPATYGGVPDKEYIATQVEVSQRGVISSNDPIETTDDLSKQLFTEYLAMKQTGDIDPQNVALLVERINQNIFSRPSDGLYTSSDIQTFSESDKAKLTKYADTFISARNRYAQIFANQTSSFTSESAMFEQALFASDLYLRLAEELMTLETPSGGVAYHIAYVNSLKESAQGLKELGSDEPLNAALGIKRHTDAQIKQESAATALSLFLTQNGIISFNLLPL